MNSQQKKGLGSDDLPLDELFKVHANLFGGLIPDLGDLPCWLEGSISWHGSRGLCRGARGVGQTGCVHPGGQVMLRVDKVGRVHRVVCLSGERKGVRVEGFLFFSSGRRV